MWTALLGSLRAALFAYTSIFWETDGYRLSHWNTAGDAGGPTSWGIASEYHPSIADKIRTRRLQLAEAVRYIDANFYQQLERATGGLFSQINHRVAFVVFDAYFNGGPGGATHTVRHLQAFLNKMGHRLVEDGVMGPNTARAVLGLQDRDVFMWLNEYKGAGRKLGSALGKATLKSKAKEGKSTNDWSNNYSERAAWRAEQAMNMPVC